MLFSALEGSHRDNPLKDLSVGRDAGQGLISGTFPGRLATMHFIPASLRILERLHATEIGGQTEQGLEKLMGHMINRQSQAFSCNGSFS